MDILTTPTHQRAAYLFENYCFICKCERCLNQSDDDKMIGLRCSQAGCVGDVQRVESVEINETNLSSLLSQTSWRCCSCNNVNFEKSIELINKNMQVIENLSKQKVYNENDVEQADKVFKKLTSFCKNYSCYIHRAGAILSLAIINTMHDSAPDNVLYTKFERAFTVLTLIDISPQEKLFHCCLDHLYRKCSLAKLYLSLYPDPYRAIDMLSSTQKYLSPFYSKNHRIMIQIQELLNTH